MHIRVLRAGVAVAVLFGGGGPAALAQDVLITNAIVVDGTGAPARPADVRIVGGRIEAIGPPGTINRGARVVDAERLTLAPGFIDTHSHHDRGIFDRRDALAAVSQGVTTIVVGQDGESNLPLSSFFRRLDSEPGAVNVASYVGHGTLRARVMGDDYRRPASEDEVRRMTDLLREEVTAGAHPRGFGSFTRVLGRYVRDERVVTVEDAVRKMTALSAANVGITDRGTISPGMAADLVLFDPGTVAERAALAEPHAVSVGIHTVWVNGDIVYANSRPTGALPGRALRRPRTAAPAALARRPDGR